MPEGQLSRAWPQKHPHSAGDAELVVVILFERTNGKELVATGDAAVGGHAEEALERGGKAGHVFGCDALQIVIAADGAVSGKAVGERRSPTAKADSAARASPRQTAYNGGREVPKGASARPTAGRRMAGWANHQDVPLNDLDYRR